MHERLAFGQTWAEYHLLWPWWHYFTVWISISSSVNQLWCSPCGSWEDVGGQVCDSPAYRGHRVSPRLLLSVLSTAPQSHFCSVKYTMSWERREKSTAHKLGTTHRSRHPPGDPGKLCCGWWAGGWDSFPGTVFTVPVSHSVFFTPLPSVSGCWRSESEV